MGEDFGAVEHRFEMLASRCERAEARCLSAARRVQAVAAVALAGVILSGLYGSRTPAAADDEKKTLEKRVAKLEKQMEEVKDDLKSEKDKRKAADEALRSKIEAEIARAKAAENDLQNQINGLGNAELRQDLDEEIARAKAAEMALQAALDAEIAARQTADADTLAASKSYTDNEIAKEKQAREAADTALQAQIDNLGGGNDHETRIAALENKTQFISVTGNSMSVLVPDTLLMKGTNSLTLKSGMASSIIELVGDNIHVQTKGTLAIEGVVAQMFLEELVVEAFGSTMKLGDGNLEIQADGDVRVSGQSLETTCSETYKVSAKTAKTECTFFDLEVADNCSIDAKTVNQTSEDLALTVAGELSLGASAFQLGVDDFELKASRVVNVFCSTQRTLAQESIVTRTPLYLSTAVDGDDDPESAEFALYHPTRASNQPGTVRVHGGNLYLRNRLGIQNQADRSGNFCIGYGTNPNLIQSHSIVYGTGNSGTGTGNIYWGDFNSCSGDFCVLFGEQHFASGRYLSLLGGKGCGVFGSNNTNCGGLSQSLSGTGAWGAGTFRSGASNLTVGRIFSLGQ